VQAPGRALWSVQPLKKTEPAVSKNDRWSKTSIDRFLYSAMEKGGVSPNPAVNKQQLLRRAYLDLIGLPPTPEDVDAF